MKKQYIRISNERPSLSIGTYLFWFITLRYFNAPQWVYGVYGVVVVAMVVGFFYRLCTEEAVNVVKR